MNLKGVIIAVDFDGTCVKHEYPNIGGEIGAPHVLKRIVKEGGKLILWTMRSGDVLKQAEQWFKDNDIPLYGSQRNPTQDTWTDSPKAYAQLYIDDAAIGCPLIKESCGWYGRDGADRPFVDWVRVEEMIFPKPKE